MEIRYTEVRRCSSPAISFPAVLLGLWADIYIGYSEGAGDTTYSIHDCIWRDHGRALIGLPPSLVEIYGSDIKKVYLANGVPFISWYGIDQYLGVYPPVYYEHYPAYCRSACL